MSRAAFLAAGVLALATAQARSQAATGAESPCEVSATLEPARAFVGQQVLHRRVVVRPEGPTPEWTAPLRFPGFRVETLDAGGWEQTIWRGQDAVRVESLTALFPVRAGKWRLPGGRIRCADGEVIVPGPAFEAMPWPETDRPEDFTGVIGAIDIRATIEESVHLGGTLRLHVTTRGAANLWEAVPRVQVEPADTEIFQRQPRVTLRGDEILRAVRHDVFDLVPRREGELRIAPLRIAYLDPVTGRYGTAATAPRRVRVLPGAASEPLGVAKALAPADAAKTPRSRVVSFLLVVLAMGAAASLAGILAVVLLRRRAGPARTALRDADHAASADAKAMALERALRAHLTACGLDPIGNTTQALLEGSPDETTRECVRALDALERGRFDGTGRSADLDGIRALLARIPRA